MAATLLGLTGVTGIDVLILLIAGDPVFNEYFFGLETRLFIICLENDELAASLLPSILGRFGDGFGLLVESGWVARCRLRVMTSFTLMSSTGSWAAECSLLTDGDLNFEST